MTSYWMTASELAKKASVGDLVEFERLHSHHWAVYCGDDNGNPIVIHFYFPKANKSNSIMKLLIREDNLFEVANDCFCRVNNSLDFELRPSPPQEIIKSAQIGLGKCDYHVIFNNCEHFAHLCRYGQPTSRQISERCAYSLRRIMRAGTHIICSTLVNKQTFTMLTQLAENFFAS